MTEIGIQSVILLGSTGSIGTQTLDVIRRYPDRFRVKALAAGNNLIRLAEQVQMFQPEIVAIREANRIGALKQLLPGYRGDILSGPEGLLALAADIPADILVVGLVGILGLKPTLSALQAGKRVLTANKETFVAGGHLVAQWLDRILPLDSEHSAIHQCLRGESRQDVQKNVKEVKKIILTASGGPFRGYDVCKLAEVTPRHALRHPNWVMGEKVSIDSATLMNKGLEIIEAHWLFQMPYEAIQPVIHPQSIVHSAVEFQDGSVIAQMGTPDMRLPIQYALAYPDRLDAVSPESCLDFLKLGRLDFEPPDTACFPCLPLAFEAGHAGSCATAALNAADETAVRLFLEEKIRFPDIYNILARIVEEQAALNYPRFPNLDEIESIDDWARTRAQEIAGRAAVSTALNAG